MHLKKTFRRSSPKVLSPGEPLLLGAQALMERFKRIYLRCRATPVATPLVEVLERRRGVCQDLFTLMLACLRSRGLAARYISGYLLDPATARPATADWRGCVPCVGIDSVLPGVRLGGF